MKTCFEKGTFEIVDLPQGVLELPSMFQYKLKLGPTGEFVKCKGRLCARGDLQQDHKYGKTFAPTSCFSMVCLIIAIATQQHHCLLLTRRHSLTALSAQPLRLMIKRGGKSEE
eukprot:793018-Rhodomonas_salina.1